MESQVRSATKSFIWRIVGVLVLGTVTYCYTGNWITTSWITFLHHGVFLFVFWAHERFYLHTDFTGLTRKILKCITYETILGNFILAIITLAITGDVQKMSQITLTYISIKHIIYIINETWWQKVKWGIKN